MESMCVCVCVHEALWVPSLATSNQINKHMKGLSKETILNQCCSVLNMDSIHNLVLLLWK